jgi:hypothetical protein
MRGRRRSRPSAVALLAASLLGWGCGSEAPEGTTEQHDGPGRSTTPATEEPYAEIVVDEESWFTFQGNRLFQLSSADPSSCIQVSDVFAFSEGEICSSVDVPSSVEAVQLYRGPTVLTEHGAAVPDQVGLESMLVYSTDSISAGSLHWEAPDGRRRVTRSEAAFGSFVTFVFPASADDLRLRLSHLDGGDVVCAVGDSMSSLIRSSECS